eukprot:10877940-Karenia_brevis.AAC.1
MLPIPTHRPLQVELAAGKMCQEIYRMCLPKAFPLSDWKLWDEQDEEAACLESLLKEEAEWQSFFNAKDVE